MPTGAPAVLDTARLQSGTQTLLRGLAILEASAAGAHDLKTLGALLGTTRSTTHRLVSSLVHARYLRLGPDGIALGPRLIELGAVALEQMPLTTVALPHLQSLAAATHDTVHLGVRDGNDVLYIHKIAGTRGLEMRSRIGHRMPLATTGIGRALMLDLSPEEWARLQGIADAGQGAGEDTERVAGDAAGRVRRTDATDAADDAARHDAGIYAHRMSQYAARGCALDIEDNEPSICCVAAPVRDATDRIVAAISVASTAHYMTPERMEQLIPVVQQHGRAISEELGWRAPAGNRTIRR
ncbi:IclR family transcriptional regulator [Robbsia sp. Bb-Pol-6]|uniref:IclR family transcriptional regulator n=2 Tax=Robbsia betulipollinis TaxID=2981849 RepID=A0ABT3ZSH7_9BURK|nr:IclR family transcriptional regulator [Robbsia betulipollinis]MCY0389442.1 IclR family transcriptional regulator [Robbsia betulipollinis]